MRRVPLAAAALVVATLLASCGDDTPRTASPADSATVSSAPASLDKTIADGTYSKTVTAADARAVGVTEKDFLRSLGKDGETTYALKIAGKRWTMFVVEDDAPEPGDLGTLEYDEGDVDMVSESTGCFQCVYTYGWRLTGDALSLTLVGHESTDDPAGLATVRFVTEGEFRRQS